TGASLWKWRSEGGMMERLLPQRFCPPSELGNPQKTRVSTFPQRRRLLLSNWTQLLNPRKSNVSTDSRPEPKIEYPEPEKAYLAGLLHDLGFLVNSILYTDDFRECLRRASEQHVPLHVIEEQVLGFTHCETGQMLSEHWGLSRELVDAVGCHHDVSLLPDAGPLACLVHLSDLLCRVRYLGYGYDEIIGVDLGSDAAWQSLVRTYPALGTMDLVRFTLDIDGAMDQIVATVNSVFGAKRIAAPATA